MVSAVSVDLWLIMGEEVIAVEIEASGKRDRMLDVSFVMVPLVAFEVIRTRVRPPRFCRSVDDIYSESELFGEFYSLRSIYDVQFEFHYSQ